MGEIKSLIPRRSEVERQPSDYICNAQRELSMVRGAVSVALLMADPEKDGPKPQDVYGFLQLLDDHFNTMDDQLNGAQAALLDDVHQLAEEEE